MNSETVLEIVKNCTSKLSYSEFVHKLMVGKNVEIYFGDDYERVVKDQTEMEYPAVICGKLITAHQDCLVVEAFNSEINGKPSLIFINEKNIVALKEISEYNIQDYMLNSKFVKKRKGY